jgi:hypothetical protein
MKQAPKHSGGFFKNNDWKKLILFKKIIDDRTINLLDENMKRSLYSRGW